MASSTANPALIVTDDPPTSGIDCTSTRSYNTHDLVAHTVQEQSHQLLQLFKHRVQKWRQAKPELTTRAFQ
jgi:hypothetical protein